MALTLLNKADGIEWPTGFYPQSQLDRRHVDIWIAALGGYGVVSGCAVTLTGTPDEYVQVADGVVRRGDLQTTTVSAGAVKVLGTAPGQAAHATKSRCTMIVADVGGAKSAIHGADADGTLTDPVLVPDYDETTYMAIALVLVTPAVTTVNLVGGKTPLQDMRCVPNHVAGGSGVAKINDALQFRKVTSAVIDGNDEINVPLSTMLYVTCTTGADILKSIGIGYEGQVVILAPNTAKDITLQHGGSPSAGHYALKIAGEQNYLMDQDHDMVWAKCNVSNQSWDVMIPGIIYTIPTVPVRVIKITLTDDTASFSNLGFDNSWEGGGTPTPSGIVASSFTPVVLAHQYEIFRNGVSAGTVTIGAGASRGTGSWTGSALGTDVKLDIDRIDANTTDHTGGVIQFYIVVPA